MVITMSDRIIEYLNQFESPDAIAEECRRLGVRGLPDRCECCAVANLVIRRFGEVPINIEPCTVASMASFGIYEGDHFKLPPPVNEFALAFDRGEYPELVQE